MDDTPISIDEARNLRFLRRLVTVLTATMILGLLTITVLLVIRLSTPPTTFQLPDAITLPNGSRATAFTQGSDWYAVVTDGDEILIFDNGTNTLRQTIQITSK
ncbi:MAG: DUF6476 family protein [Paracoccaceae bacterium]